MPLGKEVGLGPGHIVLDGDPVVTQLPPQQPIATFRPMSIVAKRSPISATAKLLLPITNLSKCSVSEPSFRLYVIAARFLYNF